LEHLEQTHGQITRLETICEELGISPKGKKCKGMECLLADGSELIMEGAEPDVMDAGLISAAQPIPRVLHARPREPGRAG
jgi:ferritin-like metal-binding protein YciE